MLGGHMGHIDQRLPQDGMTISFTAAYGADPDLGKLWAEQFAQSDPWMMALDRKLKAGEIGTGNAYVNFADFSRSDCYDACYRPADIRDGMVMPFRKDADAQSFMIIDCGGAKHAFDADDLKIANQLFPHLSRALGFRERVAELEKLAGQYELALDRFDTPLLALNENARVLFANRSAVTLMRQADSPFSERAGLFVIDDVRAENVLREALRRPLLAPPSIAVSRAGSVPPILVHIMPITGVRLRDISPGRGAAVALVALTDTARSPAGKVKALATVFGFTPAEAQVASMIASGADIESIAVTSGRSPETVRTHVKSLLSRTGTRRQSELVATLLRAIAPFRER